MKKHRLPNFWLTLVAAACAVMWAAVLPAFADAKSDAFKTVVLDSLSSTDDYAREQIAKIKAAKGKVSAIELYHVGDENPPELQALARWFAAEGITVKYQKISL